MDDFSSNLSCVMHLDLNSCFATIEQQANPQLRGKPLVVAAYVAPGGCILAASVEAKKLGIKTGMRVRDGKAVISSLIVLPPDPAKYRDVHLKLRRLLSGYTNKLTPKSIDEFVLDFRDFIKVGPCTCRVQPCKGNLWHVAVEIKQRIKKEIGEWLTVSVGISTNRFLAKTASNLHKPDGLDEINSKNFLEVYAKLKLTDLCGIKLHNATRLNSLGIISVLDFYQAPLWKLKSAFESVCGYYWYQRLRGWEADDFVSRRSSYGNSYALPASPKMSSRGGPQPFSKIEDLSPILAKLTEKMGFRLRSAGFKARGIHLALLFREGSIWHKGLSFNEAIFDSREIYKKLLRLLLLANPQKPVSQIAVSVFNLTGANFSQLELFSDVVKKEKLVKSADLINKRWGNFVVFSARMANTQDCVPDRIAFGGVKELEEFTLNL